MLDLGMERSYPKVTGTRVMNAFNGSCKKSYFRNYFYAKRLGLSGPA
ncbi:hypothetical protein SAMN05216316_1725 [Nitrosovibrio sp. Nv6]|nr:hypothetical protein SAMN05216316_1725 [Nitrosovibrio sp. Nv6]